MSLITGCDDGQMMSAFYLTYSTLPLLKQLLYLLYARTVHMRSNSVIYHAQIVHACQRHVSKELCGHLYVHVAVISYYEQKFRVLTNLVS